MSGTVYSIGPLATYNWNPAVQLKNLLADEVGVRAGNGPGAIVALLGDSTTDGFGTAPSNYIATTSLAAQLTAALETDDVVANQADFMGQGNELAIDTDTRMSLFGGAEWSFPMGAGGEIVGMSQIGAGLTFAPGSTVASRSLTLDYYNVGSAQLSVSVNGKTIGTVAVGSTGLLAATTFTLPAAEIVTSVTVTDANGSSAYLEGVTLASATSSVQVVDAGVGGAESSAVGTGQPETTPYNATIINAEAAESPTIAFVNFGINDVLQGNLTAAQTTANLQLIVQELQAVGTEAVIVIPNPITAPGWATEIGTLRADVYALAVQLNVGVIDLSATSSDNAAALQTGGLLNADGVHPTAAYAAQVATQLAGLLTAPLAQPPTVTPPIVATPIGTCTVLTASAFFSTLGVDTHIPYTDGGYANISKMLSNLQYLGITNVRDGLSNGVGGSAPLSSFETLAKAGIKLTTIIGGGGAWTPQSLQSSLSLIEQLQKAVPGSVEAVEGVNEINNQPITWTPTSGATQSALQAAVGLQSALYSAVHSDTMLAGVPVDYFTGYSAGSVAAGPNPYTTPGLADYDNQHPYPGSAGPKAYVAPSVALPNEAGALGPAVYTETGYSTDSVSQTAQAQGDLDILMDDACNGVSQTYLYQLLDAYQPGSPQGDDGYGLFDPDGVAKTAAVAIHDLTTILADTGKPLAKPVAPGFTVSGLPKDGSTLDIEKSNGTQEFVVWNETSGSQAVTVNLGAAYNNVAVFDPIAGLTAIATYTDVSSVNLTLDDSPLIVQVSSLLAPVVVPAPSAPSLAASSDSGVVGDGITNVTLPTFNGTAAASDEVKLYDAAGLLGTATASSSGAWSITAAQALAAGTYGLFATATSALGTISVDSASFLLTIDTQAPPAPAALILAAASGDGVAGQTQSTTPMISGTAVTGDAVSLYDNGTRIGSVAASATGAWSITPATALALGVQDFTATATDVAGNVSAASSVLAVSVVAPPVTTLGGSDTLLLNVAEAAINGSGKNAEFTVSVDGTQIGGMRTVTGLETAGGGQVINLTGKFGAAGPHTVAVTYLDGFTGSVANWGGMLFINAVSMDGLTVFPDTQTQYNGTSSYTLQKPAAPVLSNAGTQDKLILNLSELAVGGKDAMFMVSVDGQLVGGIQSVTASKSAGQSQNVTLTGDFGAGAHNVAIDFLNGFSGNVADAGRTLYVNSITLNGNTTTENTSTGYDGVLSCTVKSG